jgi:transcriptional regulator with XRE-family HTH domain
VAKRGKARVGSDLSPPPETWLARYRREAAVDQAELARATGISERTLQRLERGDNTNPPIRYLVSCAAALGLDDWHLLLEDEWTRPLKQGRPERAKPSAFLRARS